MPLLLFVAALQPTGNVILKTKTNTLVCVKEVCAAANMKSTTTDTKISMTVYTYTHMQYEPDTAANPWEILSSRQVFDVTFHIQVCRVKISTPHLTQQRRHVVGLVVSDDGDSDLLCASLMSCIRPGPPGRRCVCLGKQGRPHCAGAAAANGRECVPQRHPMGLCRLLLLLLLTSSSSLQSPMW